jgi:hypothetical protein
VNENAMRPGACSVMSRSRELRLQDQVPETKTPRNSAASKDEVMDA